MVDSVASIPNVSRIRNDVRKLLKAGVPDDEIDEYLTEQGVTPDQILKFNPSQAEDIAQSGVSGIKSGAEMAVGSAGEMERLPTRIAGKVAGWMGAEPETVEKIQSYRIPSMLAPQSALGMAADAIPGVSDWMKRRTGRTASEWTAPPTTEQVKSGLDQTELSRMNWDPQTKAGEYTKVGTEGATAGVLTGGRRVIPNLIGGALAGVGGQAAADTFGDSPAVRLGGGIAASLLPGGFNRLVRPTGPRDPDLLAAQAVTDREGIRSSAGQRTGKRWLQRAEAQLSPDRASDFVTGQKQDLSRAAARNAGMNDLQLPTAENLANNRARIGQTMDQLAANTVVPFDHVTQTNLLDAAIRQTEVGANPASMQTVQGVMDHMNTLAQQNGGVLSGQAYQNITTRIRELRSSRGLDAAADQALERMQGALEDAVERSATPEVRQQWTTARNQYRNQLILEDTVTQGPAGDQFSGIVSPERLNRSTDKIEGPQRVATQSNSPMTELSTAAAKIMPHVTDSGTAQNQMIGNPLMWGPLAVRSVAGRGLWSDPVQGWLSSNGPQIPSRAALASIIALRQNANRESDVYDRR